MPARLARPAAGFSQHEAGSRHRDGGLDPRDCGPKRHGDGKDSSRAVRATTAVYADVPAIAAHDLARNPEGGESRSHAGVRT